MLVSVSSTSFLNGTVFFIEEEEDFIKGNNMLPIARTQNNIILLGPSYRKHGYARYREHVFTF